MNKQDREKLSAKIGELMAINASEWPGTPFVNADGSFGLTAGKRMGGLWDIYSLIDALAGGRVFKGRQNPGTDLDTATYTLSAGKVFHVYDEVDLFWNKDKELQLTVRTDVPLDDILQAIEGGIARKQEELEQHAREEQDYRNEILRDKERDKLPTVFTAETDEKLAKAYIAMRVRETVPSSNLAVTTEAIAPELSKVLDDTRPRIRVEYDLGPIKTFLQVNALHNEVLPQVFRGHNPVFAAQTSVKDRLYVEVAGPPARLVNDIFDNDLNGARRAAKTLEGDVSADMLKRILREIDRRENALGITDSMRDGLVNDTPAPAAASFRRQR